MRSGEGFLLVYSITDRDSFDSIGAYHQQILRVKDTESVPIVLVGNKCDLEDGRCVAKNGTSTHVSLPAACITFPTSAARVMWNVVEGRYICEELGCRFVETSAKLGLNVEETFLNVVRRIRDHNRVCAYCSSLFCEPLMQCLLGAAPSTPHIADDDGPFPGDRITRSRLLEQWLHRDLIEARGPTWLAVHTVRRLPHSGFPHAVRPSSTAEHRTCVSEKHAAATPRGWRVDGERCCMS